MSVVKKGYSGVVVMCKSREGKRGGGGQTTLDDAFGAKEASEGRGRVRVRRTRLVSIEEGLGSRGYTDEGRTLTLEFDGFYLVTAYVPNSGQDLKRLGYRIDEWERDIARLKELDAKKPVVYVGDLNVAHRDEDIWNVTASHIKKSAGTTPQEREAFGVMLEENKLVDAFASSTRARRVGSPTGACAPGTDPSTKVYDSTTRSPRDDSSTADRTASRSSTPSFSTSTKARTTVRRHHARRVNHPRSTSPRTATYLRCK